MTIEIALLLALIGTMAFFFLTEKVPLELTAFLGLVILVLGGFVPAPEAFLGFSSSAVITMLSMFFLSAAFVKTGIADVIGDKVEALIGAREVLLITAVVLVAGLLSSFMNNVAATAVLLPAVASIARRTGVSPSRLFMPLSFGAVLGGTVTVVGTPPNILANDLMAQRGVMPFGLFDFAPVGLLLLAAGILYLVLVGRRLLPNRAGPTAVSRRSDLIQVYQLHDNLFSIRIPRGSRVAGRTLRDTALGRTLGVQVVGILRDGQRRLAPDAQTLLLEDDVLLVQGSAREVRELFRVRGTEFSEAAEEILDEASGGVSGIVATVRPDSRIAGRTVRNLRFRERFGAIVVAMRRDGKILRGDLGGLSLQDGDELIGLGTREQIDNEGLRRYFEVAPMRADLFRALRGHVYVLSVPEGSGLDGTTLAESRMGELVGLTVSGIQRGSQWLLGLVPDERILAGDRLLVSGEPGRIRGLLELGDVNLQQEVAETDLESETTGVLEATLAPRSRAAGQTLAELNFRERHGLHVLAVWREGDLIHEGLGEVRLRFGDALLLHGPRARLRMITQDPDFVALDAPPEEERAARTRKAPYAIAAFLLMIAFVMTGYQPIHVAAFTAATFVILTRTISMEEAYRAVQWRAVFVVAALLPMGVALEQTGAATMLARTVVDVAGPGGPYAVLAALVVLSSALSQTLDGGPAVVLLAPVALTVAGELGVDPAPVMMGVALGASAAFMTPFSHKAHLLVMGAGAYRSSDYLRVGTPLTILVLILTVLLVPLLFPFTG